MALVSTPSLEGFNSFVSVEEADTYFEGVYFGSGKKWSDFTDDSEKEALLITATRKLNSLPWGGSTYSAAQALAFPRKFESTGEYGYRYAQGVAPVPIKGWIPVAALEEMGVAPDEYIPDWLKQATCEMARWLWSEEDRPATDAEFAMLKSMKVGPLDYQFRDSALALPPSVSSILASVGNHIIDMSTGPKTKRMVF